MFDQREIVLVPFPNADLTGAKQRPALIISNQKLNKSHDRLCCFITSNPDAKGLAISPGTLETGTLPFASKVKPQRVFTIDQRLIKRTLCRTTKAFHERVLKELHEHICAEK